MRLKAACRELKAIRKEKQKETAAKKRAEVCFFIYVLTVIGCRMYMLKFIR